MYSAKIKTAYLRHRQNPSKNLNIANR